MSAKAIEKTELAIIPRSDFDMFIHSHGWALNTFIRQMAAEAGDYQQLLARHGLQLLKEKSGGNPAAPPLPKTTPSFTAKLLAGEQAHAGCISRRGNGIVDPNA